MSLIGLCGSHRTGKTSLARAYAEKQKIAFVETSVSAIFRELGHDPATAFDFKTRLDIQEVILDRLDQVYGKLDPAALAITDRTPIDMLAYTMAEAVGAAVGEAEQARFARYTQRCLEVTNKRFSTLVLLQPGIPLVFEEGKALMNPAYIEHLNSLMLGLSVDERVKCSHFYILRRLTDMNERVEALDSAVRKSEYFAQQQVEAHVIRGGYLQ